MASTTRKCFARQSQSWVLQYDSQAPINSDVVTTTNGNLLSVLVTNKAATGTLFLMLFDASAVPSNGAVPLMAPIAVPFGTTQAIQLHNSVGHGSWDGVTFNTALCWAASTTGTTLTVDSTNSIWVTARYVN